MSWDTAVGLCGCVGTVWSSEGLPFWQCDSLGFGLFIFFKSGQRAPSTKAPLLNYSSVWIWPGTLGVWRLLLWWGEHRLFEAHCELWHLLYSAFGGCDSSLGWWYLAEGSGPTVNLQHVVQVSLLFWGSSLQSLPSSALLESLHPIISAVRKPGPLCFFMLWLRYLLVGSWCNSLRQGLLASSVWILQGLKTCFECI